MNDEEITALTCTRCNEAQEFYCRIVYSQGDRVCVDCKKETQASDNLAFDRHQNSRGIY
jgi:hypothetical protein